MRIIDDQGNYQYITGTKTVAQSDHPAYQARIELALGKGTWPFAKDRGHQLAKYSRADQTPEKIEAYRKEVLLYLKKYGPEVTRLISERGSIDIKLGINKDALDG